jgi:hypothetical protein
METLKNKQSQVNNSIFQIKISIKSLVNRVEFKWKTVSGMEEKV